jgi:hypothetical protein
MHAVDVGQPSTVGEHREGVIHDHVPANAPGRIEGRCEHHDRAVVLSRATRPGLCCVRGVKPRPRRRALTRHGQRRLAPSRRWQTRHAPRRPPRRRREPRSSRIGPLPSVLPGSSRAPHGEHARHARPPPRRCRAATWPSSSPAFVASRNPRCNARSGRHAAEHGRRAPRGRDSRSRSRECSRQDRGEVRAPRPCSRALTCHAPRPLLRPRCEAATTPSCAKATRAAAPCSVAPMADATRATASAASQARTTIFAHRAAPLGPAGLFARPSRQAREHATLDSRCRARARARAPRYCRAFTTSWPVRARARACTVVL